MRLEKISLSARHCISLSYGAIVSQVTSRMAGGITRNGVHLLDGIMRITSHFITYLLTRGVRIVALLHCGKNRSLRRINSENGAKTIAQRCYAPAFSHLIVCQ